MSRNKEFGGHNDGRLSLTGWAGARSLKGVLLYASVYARFYAQD
jgi:hypothetical protein